MWDRMLPDAGPQALANVLWACGKLRYTSPQLWSSTLEAFMQRLQQNDQRILCQNLSNVLYGMATAATGNRGKVPGTSKSAAEAAVAEVTERMRVLVTHPQLEGVKSQEISNTLWACAKLRISPGDAALNSLLQAMS
jgi:hypothetical protein